MPNPDLIDANPVRPAPVDGGCHTLIPMKSGQGVPRCSHTLQYVLSLSKGGCALKVWHPTTGS